nr:hypothetical protein [Mixta theicola]
MRPLAITIFSANQRRAHGGPASCNGGARPLTIHAVPPTQGEIKLTNKSKASPSATNAVPPGSGKEA